MTLLIDRPVKPNGIWCVFDATTLTDARLQAHGASGTPVYRKNAMLRAICEENFTGTTRVALFRHGEATDAKERKRRKEALLRLIRSEGPGVVLVFPSPSKDQLAKGEKQTTKGTLIWEALSPPDSMDEMRGTYWRTLGTHIIPMYPCLTILDERKKEVNRQWFRTALAVHRGALQIVEPRQRLFNLEPAVLEALSVVAEATDTVALDLETIDTKNLITALGISTTEITISLPWDRWQPSKSGLPMEPGLLDYGIGRQANNLVRRILANPNIIKVGHNVLYDITRLSRCGYEIHGSVEETLAAHAILHPTLSHGLQKAVASELPCHPWKSEFRIPGLTKDDPAYWTHEPQALRNYNALDAFHTAVLWDHVKSRLV